MNRTIMKSSKVKTMGNFNIEHFKRFFNFVCITSTTILVIYCSVQFSKNHDLSDVSFQKFGIDEEHAFPEMALLFLNPYYLLSPNKMKDLGLDVRSYWNHLSGQKWNETFKDIDYGKITKNLEDYVLHSCIRSTATLVPGQGSCQDHGNIAVEVVPHGGKSISLHYEPGKKVYDATLWINSSIFSNGRRPKYSHFFIAFTYPRQMYRVSKIWPLDRNWDTVYDSAATYSLSFALSDIQILKRRNKKEGQCIDLPNYDSIMTEELLSGFGCRPFYSTNF